MVLIFLPALNKNDATNENLCLKKRELIDSGVPWENLEIRNSQILNDKKLVNINPRSEAGGKDS